METPNTDYYRDQVFSLTNLPTIPGIALEVMEIIKSDKFSVSQLLPIIERDPPLALKLLKVANSAYYAMRYPIDELKQALVVIGMHDISHLVLGFSIIEVFKTSIKYDQQQMWNDLWRHSSGVGHIAQLITKEMNLKLNSSPYSLGLLHDIGKIVLYLLEPEKELQVLQKNNQEYSSSYEMELEIYGISHNDTGKWICEKWGLPEIISQTIAYHHTPEKIDVPGNQICTATVQIADFIYWYTDTNNNDTRLLPSTDELHGWEILQSASSKIASMSFEEFIDSISQKLDIKDKLLDLVRA